MLEEKGICCRCGGEIKPPLDPKTDWLCQKCYADTHKVRPRPNPNWHGQRILTPFEWKHARQWQEPIDERIDNESPASVPLLSGGFAKLRDGLRAGKRFGKER